MKLLMRCLLLFPFASMVVTAPVRAQTENRLNFLNETLGTMTEKMIPANVTDAPKDADSYEMTASNPAEENKANERRKAAVNDMSRGLVQDHGSREHNGRQQGSRELTDLNSNEGITVDAGKQTTGLSGVQVTGSASQDLNLQSISTRRRADGFNGTLIPGRGRQLQDWDSPEYNRGRPAVVGNGGNTDYDETREFISSETYPAVAVVPTKHMSSLSQPSKSGSS